MPASFSSFLQQPEASGVNAFFWLPVPALSMPRQARAGMTAKTSNAL